MSTALIATSYDDLAIGQSATLTRTVSAADLQLFAAVSGDTNPLHLDRDYAATTRFSEPIAHGMLSGALISAAIASHLPGPGSVYRSQSLRFTRPVHIGDTLTVTITVTEKIERSGCVRLDCKVSNQNNKVVADGIAEAIPPQASGTVKAAALPAVTLNGEDYRHR